VIPLLANSLWVASCLPAAADFRRATRDVRSVQRDVLRRILRRSGGRARIASVAEFQRQVPMGPEPVAIAEPVLRRVPTSGTTASARLIPYTASLLREFRAAVAPWIVDLVRHEPALLAGRAYWAISPVGEVGEGFADDTEYLGRAGRLVASTLAVPPSVRHIRDIEEWRRTTLQHLARCRDLTFISVWHPSFLRLLIEPLGAGEPVRLWPRLRVISCWADAAATGPARELMRRFPQARLQPKGLIATEGFVSLPLWGRDGAALAIRSHFFEFVDERGGIRLAHELLAGGEYAVVLTTGGGLHRYPLHDRVRVTGFENECPLLRFVGKQDHVADHFGEKVSEEQVRAALAGASARFLLVACEGDAYTLHVEAPEASDEELLALGARLEGGLQENVHYRYCRSLGQLDAVRVFRVTARGHECRLAAHQRRGRRMGGTKPTLLERDGGWTRELEGHRLTAGREAGQPSQV
jgi:hypothetical protein